MKLIDVAKDFASEEACLAYIETMRWPDGVACLACGCKRISQFVAVGRERTNSKGDVVRSPDRHLYQCLECKHQFSATTDTIFHDTHLPLHKWFFAVALMVDAKKGVSALQMQRDLTQGEGTRKEKKPAYKTVWYLCHRIRKAMEQGDPGRLTGRVEIDETYVGGRYDKRRKRGPWEKAPVVGVLERAKDGKCSTVRAMHVPNVTGKVLTGIVTNSVSPKAPMKRRAIADLARGAIITRR
jgi:hypothetical protein